VGTLLTLKEEALRTDAQKAVLRNATVLHRSLTALTEERQLALAQMLAERTFLVVVSTPEYFTGRGGVVPFALTSQVLQHAEWTPEVLKARQEELLGVLFEEWRL
jgi:hypothetical protein